MSVKNTMRVGVCHVYKTPAGLDGYDKEAWLINHMHERGCKALQVSPPDDKDEQKKIRDLAAEKDVLLEIYAGPVFGLKGDTYAESKAGVEERISVAKTLGIHILRMGYGRLKIPSSRFSNDFESIDAHLEAIAEPLKEGIKMLEDAGMKLAVENHCDFSGTEMVQLFELVGSKSVGCALDTANSYTVFSDPIDDALRMAPWTITTHMKDMKMIQNDAPHGIPFIPVGCACGEGHVQIDKILDILAEKCPAAEGLPIIIELGWNRPHPYMTPDEWSNHLYEKSIDYLKEQLGQ